MRRPAALFGLALVLALAHGVARALGLADHTSVIAGQPLSEASAVLGPLHVALYLAAVLVAPVLVLGASIETLLFLRHERLSRS